MEKIFLEVRHNPSQSWSESFGGKSELKGQVFLMDGMSEHTGTHPVRTHFLL